MLTQICNNLTERQTTTAVLRQWPISCTAMVG